MIAWIIAPGQGKVVEMVLIAEDGVTVERFLLPPFHRERAI